MNRREVLKAGAAAAISAGLSELGCSRPVVQPPGKFLTGAELALVDELSELIIPTDAHSPGARAAKVADFIDGQIAEAWEAADRTDWRGGLLRVEQIAREMHGKAFMELAPDQRIAVLTRIAKNEAKPQTVEEKFFVELKGRVVHAYYSSRIGIHQELEYKGNVLLQELAGTDVSGAVPTATSTGRSVGQGTGLPAAIAEGPSAVA